MNLEYELEQEKSQYELQLTLNVQEYTERKLRELNFLHITKISALNVKHKQTLETNMEEKIDHLFTMALVQFEYKLTHDFEFAKLYYTELCRIIFELPYEIHKIKLTQAMHPWMHSFLKSCDRHCELEDYTKIGLIAISTETTIHIGPEIQLERQKELLRIFIKNKIGR